MGANRIFKRQKEKLGEIVKRQSKYFFNPKTKEKTLVSRQEGKYDNGGYDSGIRWIKTGAYQEIKFKRIIHPRHKRSLKSTSAVKQ